jgi:hypothetical protein
VQEVSIFRTLSSQERLVAASGLTTVIRNMSDSTKTTIGGVWYLEFQRVASIRGSTPSSGSRAKIGIRGDLKDLLTVGQEVNAMHSATAERMYYPGTVAVVNTDQTYSVEFTDGHWEESLARNMIRRVDREIRSKDKRVAETNFRTRAMKPDITAAELRLILMDDLGTGNVAVSQPLCIKDENALSYCSFLTE